MGCVACAVSWATWPLFTGVLARCFVLCVRCPGPLGSCSTVCPLGALRRVVASRVQCSGPIGFCSPLCPLGVLCRVCGVLGHLAPVHHCARSVLCGQSVRCLGPLGSCSPVCPLGVLCCVCGALGHLARVHRCARLVCCVACVVSRATWFLFFCVPAWCVVSCVRCPGPLGSCSPVC